MLFSHNVSIVILFPNSNIHSFFNLLLEYSKTNTHKWFHNIISIMLYYFLLTKQQWKWKLLVQKVQARQSAAENCFQKKSDNDTTVLEGGVKNFVMTMHKFKQGMARVKNGTFIVK